MAREQCHTAQREGGRSAVLSEMVGSVSSAWISGEISTAVTWGDRVAFQTERLEPGPEFKTARGRSPVTRVGDWAGRTGWKVPAGPTAPGQGQEAHFWMQGWVGTVPSDGGSASFRLCVLVPRFRVPA